MDEALIETASTRLAAGLTHAPMQWAYHAPARAVMKRRQPTEEGEMLVTHARPSRRRARLERFIRDEYREHFGARIRSFMPVLVGLHDARGEVMSAVGCRPAADDPLFLETYTRAPIEAVIAERLGVEVQRSEIVEVGSLACRNGRVAMAMVQALVPYLLGAGFSWVVLTGADTVVRVFERLRLAPTEICRADRRLLDASARGAWGTYYDHNPRVMAGRLLDGIRVLGCAVDQS
jgi:hypothetical protein